MKGFVEEHSGKLMLMTVLGKISAVGAGINLQWLNADL